MSNNQLGTYHLSQNKALYQPMLNNTFELIIDFDEDLIKAGDAWANALDDSGEEVGDTISNTWAQEVLRFTCNKVELPNFTQDVIKIQRSNTELKFAGRMSFNEGSIEVIDYIGADSRSVLHAWQALSGNIRTEKVGDAAKYKKNATLIEYTPDWREVRHWEIQGCWVAGVENDGVNNEGGTDKRVVKATLVFDKAILCDPDMEA